MVRMNYLHALTGTLRTIPREINVGYVIAIPKFTRMLKAEEREATTKGNHNVHNNRILDL